MEVFLIMPGSHKIQLDKIISWAFFFPNAFVNADELAFWIPESGKILLYVNKEEIVVLKFLLALTILGFN